ncbi:Zn-dependent peptidase ImmA (M78 family) [Leifsonia sp. AK011]|uniref:ImmA/IrrE family metallo-endopeptidase n=1 Tax=Leifsonia sp. AK011 TaxID=2723075 RepID=UPI0015CA595E|nr:ImmA/IrrE family metallo-endopeptidase [Leifsonia sp. AK011]NYF09925.1 Zn-dependent peptidase ImmA (M78 family) [Leifsonia sp. AK011]
MGIGRVAAAQAAAEAFDDFGFDPSEPVDPFLAINNLGLELLFWDLGDLLGVIAPGAPSGVLINRLRPASVQRFTAAHEIGHWYLDQDHLALDTEETVEGLPKTQRERNAQTFASHFLMPLDLLHRVAEDHGVTKGSAINPVTAYSMARDMHVSYTAAVHQLGNCHFISDAERTALLRVSPQRSKIELTHGRKPSNPRGDVWVIGEQDDLEQLEVFRGDEIVFELAENPSTGYRWMQSELLAHLPPRMAPLPVAGGYPDWARRAKRLVHAVDEPMPRVADDFDGSVATPVTVGQSGVRRIGFNAAHPGSWKVELKHVRPFDPEKVLASRVLNTLVRPLPDEEERRRRLEQFRLEEFEESLDGA